MPTETREARLRRTVGLSAQWLLLLGLLHLLLSAKVSSWLGLRYDIFMASYVRFSGLAHLTLGLYLLQSLKDPRRQSLAVDALLLLLLGRIIIILQARLSTGWASTFEWAAAAVDLGLASSLLLHRTRSGELGQDAPLLAADARELARQTRAWIKGRGPRPQLLMEPDDESEAASPAAPQRPAPAPAVAPAAVAVPTPPASPAPSAPTPPAASGTVPPPPGSQAATGPPDKPKSEPIPHMD